MKIASNLQKWYARAIAIAYLSFIIFFIKDLMTSGYNPVVWNKVMHIILGVYAGWIGFFAKKGNFRIFALVNGISFEALEIIGWYIPAFLGVISFNKLSVILHTIVGSIGLILAYWTHKEF